MPQYKCATIKDIPSMECTTFDGVKWEFKEGLCYENGEYFGDIIFYDGKTLKVRYGGNNEYMKLNVITFHIPQ